MFPSPAATTADSASLLPTGSKNGDRWTITRIGWRGDLTVRHTRSRLTVRMPLDYVREWTGLGYASTIHSVQGVSADTMHGLLTGQEFRQQLYTMLTRGRHANHFYLQVVGEGDPHTLIRPDTVSPRTPTETLQQIIARDEAPVSPGYSSNAPCPSSLGGLPGAIPAGRRPRRPVQDHACQGDAEQVWIPSGSRPSTALIREIAVWRAAGGINPQDPRPTGGTQPETLPAFWKQRLDPDIARATQRPADAKVGKREAERTAASRQRPYQRPERRPSGPSAPGR
jgi:hypothetical protein